MCIYFAVMLHLCIDIIMKESLASNVLTSIHSTVHDEKWIKYHTIAKVNITCNTAPLIIIIYIEYQDLFTAIPSYTAEPPTQATRHRILGMLLHTLNTF